MIIWMFECDRAKMNELEMLAPFFNTDGWNAKYFVNILYKKDYIISFPLVSNTE